MHKIDQIREIVPNWSNVCLINVNYKFVNLLTARIPFFPEPEYFLTIPVLVETEPEFLILIPVPAKPEPGIVFCRNYGRNMPEFDRKFGEKSKMDFKHES